MSSILDFELDQKVEKYADAIREWILKEFPDVEVTMTADTASNTEGDLHTQRVYLKTDFGVVIVMPNFAERCAAACTINLGLWHGMILEGFDDDTIDKEGKLLSKPLNHSEHSVELLGYYLTHKIFGNKK
jgi:hypothetical protein